MNNAANIARYSSHESSRDRSSKAQQLVDKLKVSSFKNNIMVECADLFYHDKFEDELDSNTSLLGFEMAYMT